MHRLLATAFAIASLALCGGALAEEESAAVDVSSEEVEPGMFAVGAYFGLGMTHAAGDGYTEMYGFDEDDKKPKFTAGGGAYFDLYLTEWFAVQAGIGFVGKGVRAKGEEDNPGVGTLKWQQRQKLAYMEIPLGAKLNIEGFQATVALGLWIALTGESKYKAEIDGDSNTTTHEWDDDDWELVRRFNLGPRITLGYAIPLGPISLVPSITWMMHLINDLDEDEIRDNPSFPADLDYSARMWNLMFNVGAEFGF